MAGDADTMYVYPASQRICWHTTFCQQVGRIWWHTKFCFGAKKFLTIEMEKTERKRGNEKEKK